MQTPSLTSRRRAGALLIAGWLAPGLLRAQPAPAASAPAPYVPQVGQAGKDVVWVPTPDAVVERMLEMTRVGPGDRVFDLGSGDGKIAIAAAKRGARATGVEFNPDMVALSRRNAKEAGVRNVRFVQGDIFKTDFSQADVVTLYLLPQLNERLKPLLLKMRPGTRVASHQFDMGDWKPDETADIDGRRALFWRVPAQVAGDWRVKVDGDERPLKLALNQQYQQVDGQAEWGGHSGALEQVQVDGPRLSFVVAEPGGTQHRFEGSVDARGRLSGQATPLGGGAGRPFSGSRG